MFTCSVFLWLVAIVVRLAGSPHAVVCRWEQILKARGTRYIVKVQCHRRAGTASQQVCIQSFKKIIIKHKLINKKTEHRKNGIAAIWLLDELFVQGLQLISSSFCKWWWYNVVTKEKPLGFFKINICHLESWIILWRNFHYVKVCEILV